MSGVDTRIAEVKLRGFRSSTSEVTLSLTNGTAKEAASCLLLGDNGSGKSSFVDAIQFALQARPPGGFGRADRRIMTRLPNIGVDAPHFVEVLLSNGQSHRRDVVFDGDIDQWVARPSEPVQEFDGSNFILRRDDILGFLRSGAGQRPALFAAFLRGIAERAIVDDPDAEGIAQLNVRLEEIRQRQIRTAQQLAVLLRVKPDRISPFNPPGVDGVFAERGLIKRALKRSRRPLTAFETKAFELRAKHHKGVDEWQNVQQEMRLLEKRKSYRTITTILTDVGDSLTSTFSQLSRSADHVRRVGLTLGEDDVSVYLTAELENGVSVSAEDFFSEANLDLLALLLYLSLLRRASEYGQAKVLVLDDVLQSIDGVIRLQVASFLLKEFGDWQLILTFHDRLWLEQFRALCGQKGHRIVEREISRWSFVEGPRLIQMGRDASQPLRAVVETASPVLLTSQAGLLLETTSDWLSKSLGTSVIRRPGDKYTLGDTWPGVLKVLRRYDISDVAEEVEKYAPLRNLVGAHYNEWATGLTLGEAHDFAVSVLALWDAVWCPICRTTVGRAGARVTCACGEFTLERAK